MIETQTLENRLLTLLNSMAELMAPWFEFSIFSQEALLYKSQALSEHKQDNTFPKRMVEGVFIETLANGKKTKTQIISVHDETLGAMIVRLRFDISWLASGFEEMKRFLSQGGSPTVISDWEVAVDQQIETFLASKALNLEALTRLEKRELILALYEKGLLNYKDATQWLAQRFNLSRATVYNHLNWAKSVRKIHIHQIDAFSEAAFGGNPAGVVLDADGLEEDTMRSLTREMNNAETAFVLSSSKADLRLRYFTPTGREMVFCGHSTVGALYMLAKEKRLKMHSPGNYQFKAETLAGVLDMGCTISKDGDIAVNFSTPPIVLETTHHKHEAIAEMFGIPINKVETQHKLYIEKTNKDLYLTVKDLKTLEAIECDIKAVTKFCKNHDITVICILTPHAFSKQNQFHMRCFAPAVGINEDLFTGSVIGGLVAYAHKNKLLTQEQGEIGLEQGHFLSRPGTVKVKYAIQQKKYNVHVFAKAKHFFSTEIQL